MSVACRWTRQLFLDYISQSRGLCSSASLLRSEESTPRKVWVSPQIERKRESWNAPEETRNIRNQIPDSEWKGGLHQFMPRREGTSIDFLNAMQKGINLRPSVIKKWWSNMQVEAAGKDQMYKAERVATLGFELGAAHFVVHRGGKVRFKNTKEWVQQDEDGLYELARHYQPGVFVEEIDASGINLVYEGLESLKNLKYLKSLSVANCPHIDDWCIDRICGQFSNSLQHLDLTGCTRVTGHGVVALARLRNLLSVNLHGLEGIKNIELICLLLQDDLPELKISGINYLNPKASEQ